MFHVALDRDEGEVIVPHGGTNNPRFCHSTETQEVYEVLDNILQGKLFLR